MKNKLSIACGVALSLYTVSVPQAIAEESVSPTQPAACSEAMPTEGQECPPAVPESQRGYGEICRRASTG